ncbi:hypothetical protein XENOCAPTIV_019575 [Xenoophorus captivus]|uniref:Uncharacterized protein n=1 Tax=Xenoophorus captivus TaxID=1517983 RepID=A0ABV0Q3U5_9TELE
MLLCRSRCCWRPRESSSPPASRSKLRRPRPQPASPWKPVRMFSPCSSDGVAHLYVFPHPNCLLFSGASLFWGQNPDQPVLQEEQEPPPSSLKPKPSPRSPPSSSSSTSTSTHDLLEHKPEEGDLTPQAASCSSSDPHSISGLQSPVLGESASMYEPPEEKQSFYQNLMESDSKREAEEDWRRKSVSVSDHSQLSQSSQQSSSSSERKQDQKKKEKGSPEADTVIRATLRRLQQLGVAVDAENLTESDKDRIKAVETARLSVSEPTVSALFPGGSVDLSLEANAIALRYLSQSQLSRLSLGGHAPQSIPVPSSSSESLLSPSNMSLATRKYMRRYGLIEEDGEDEEEQEEVRGQEVLQPLTEALNTKLLPQSQLIRELRPKMQLLARNGKPDSEDKENCSDRRPPIVRTISRQPEGSVGNILDLSRLRQLPKLF